MSRLKTNLAGLWLVLCAVLLVAPACGDDGTTTSCDEMPVDEDGSQAAEVQEWWDDAVQEGCATARGDGSFGAAGAEN
jgi:hypothetical protein